MAVLTEWKEGQGEARLFPLPPVCRPPADLIYNGQRSFGDIAANMCSYGVEVRAVGYNRPG